jgi:hypothetical protein
MKYKMASMILIHFSNFWKKLHMWYFQDKNVTHIIGPNAKLQFVRDKWIFLLLGIQDPAVVCQETKI